MVTGTDDRLIGTVQTGLNGVALTSDNSSKSLLSGNNWAGNTDFTKGRFHPAKEAISEGNKRVTDRVEPTTIGITISATRILRMGWEL
jgi:hypothetical protein